MNDAAVRILIVDDHEMVRRGMRSFLRTSDDLNVVGEASDGMEALEKCAMLEPDVIVMDIMMPQMDGVQATEAIRRQFPDVAIVALSSSSDVKTVKSVIKAGALSYLMKNVNTDQLADAIRYASRGSAMFSPEVTKALITAANEKPEFNLTDRELEMLRLLVKGLTNPEICDELHLGLGTVKSHVSTVMRKLNVSNRNEAIAVAVKNDLV